MADCPRLSVFLRMNTWLFETCRRQYNWIKSLMEKGVNFVGSYYVEMNIFTYCLKKQE